MTLQDMLADAAIQDDLEVTFGDKKFKVGDWRDADRIRKSQAAAEEKRFKEATAAVAAKRAELTALADEAKGLVEKWKTEPPEDKVTTAGDIDWDTDPLYSPVSKKLKPLEEKFAATLKQIETLQSAMTDATRIFLNDRMDRRWRDIPESDRPKDKGWPDYYKLAQERKILDAFGVPDPVEAFNREREPVLRDQQAKEITRLQAELKAAQNTPRMPRPGTSGQPKSVTDKDAKVFDSADALVDAAFNDPLIQSITAGQA